MKNCSARELTNPKKLTKMDHLGIKFTLRNDFTAGNNTSAGHLVTAQQSRNPRWLTDRYKDAANNGKPIMLHVYKSVNIGTDFK